MVGPTVQKSVAKIPIGPLDRSLSTYVRTIVAPSWLTNTVCSSSRSAHPSDSRGGYGSHSHFHAGESHPLTLQYLLPSSVCPLRRAHTTCPLSLELPTSIYATRRGNDSQAGRLPRVIRPSYVSTHPMNSF